MPDFVAGGAERVALRLMTSFVERGHLVDLILVNASGELLQLIPKEVRVIDLKAPKLRKAVIPLVRYLRSSKPHALHAMMWPLTVVAILARLVANVETRLVVSDHIALSKQYGDNPSLIRKLRWSVRLLYPWAESRIVVSAAAADDLVRLSTLRRRTIDVIYNPIDLPTDFEPVYRKTSSREKHRNEANIISVGRLKQQKNHALLLHAFVELRNTITARLTIVGDGTLHRELEALAVRLGISEEVQFAGFQLDIWPWLSAADVFVLSSDYEGFGNVLVEALYAGLPVVSTDCSGPREILDDGRYGWLVPCGDVHAMAEAIQHALRSPKDPELGRERAKDISGQNAIERHLALMCGER